MKKLRILGVGLLVALGLVGCGNSGSDTDKNADATEEHIVNLMEKSEIGSMDTLVTQDLASINAQVSVFEGLYQIDDENQVVPAVALDMPEISEDGKTYTIKLREDSKWSNGDPVTANDFVFAWQRLATPANQANYFFLLDGTIKNGTQIVNEEMEPSELGVRAEDDYTLVIELERPTPYFTSILTFPPFFPQNEKVVNEQGKAYGTTSDSIVSNGAFIMENWDQAKTSWDLVKNEEYYDADKVKLDEVHYEVIKESGTAFNLFNDGQLDMADIYGEYVKQNAANENLLTTLGSTVYYFKMNQKIDGKDSIFANEDVRKSIYYAIDKDALVNDVLANGSKTTNGFIPENFVFNPKTGADFREDSQLAGPDADKAVEYWNKAKKVIGEDSITIEILTSDADSDKKVAEFLKGQLEETLPGLELKIKSVPLNNSIELSRNSQYELLMARWGPDYQDPMTYLYNFISPNNSNYNNPDYDALIEKINNDYANDLETRWNAMIEAEKMLIEETAGIIPLYQEARSSLVSPNLKGLYYPTFGAQTVIKYAEYVAE